MLRPEVFEKIRIIYKRFCKVSLTRCYSWQITEQTTLVRAEVMVRVAQLTSLLTCEYSLLSMLNLDEYLCDHHPLKRGYVFASSNKRLWMKNPARPPAPLFIYCEVKGRLILKQKPIWIIVYQYQPTPPQPYPIPIIPPCKILILIENGVHTCFEICVIFSLLDSNGRFG